MTHLFRPGPFFPTIVISDFSSCHNFLQCKKAEMWLPICFDQLHSAIWCLVIIVCQSSKWPIFKCSINAANVQTSCTKQTFIVTLLNCTLICKQLQYTNANIQHSIDVRCTVDAFNHSEPTTMSSASMWSQTWRSNMHCGTVYVYVQLQLHQWAPLYTRPQSLLDWKQLKWRFHDLQRQPY